MSSLEGRFSELYHYLATSDEALPQVVRKLKHQVDNLELSVPMPIARPALTGYVAGRSALHFGMRVLVCQPFFRAYCKQVGRGLRTDHFIHWVQGKGDIIVGDNVWLDGKCGISFAANFTDRPVLEIGDNTGIGNNTSFSIGKRITIGKNCVLSGSTNIFDSNGHPSDPAARRAHKPPPVEEVRPVTIGDDVWIGKECIIFPGVRIGNCAIVAAGSVVRRHVPPYGVVAGNPAQLIFRLPRPESAVRTSAPTPANDGARLQDGAAGE
jgi:acetyltransferase-like isoleucine patch superfamily enzyme